MFTLYTSFVFCYKCKKTFAYCLKALFYYDQFTLYITFFTLKQRPFSSRNALENKENPSGCKMHAKWNLARLLKIQFFAIHNLRHVIFRGETILCQGQANWEQREVALVQTEKNTTWEVVQSGRRSHSSARGTHLNVPFSFNYFHSILGHKLAFFFPQ